MKAKISQVNFSASSSRNLSGRLNGGNKNATTSSNQVVGKKESINVTANLKTSINSIPEFIKMQGYDYSGETYRNVRVNASGKLVVTL